MILLLLLLSLDLRKKKHRKCKATSSVDQSNACLFSSTINCWKLSGMLILPFERAYTHRPFKQSKWQCEKTMKKSKQHLLSLSMFRINCAVCMRNERRHKQTLTYFICTHSVCLSSWLIFIWMDLIIYMNKVYHTYTLLHVCCVRSLSVSNGHICLLFIPVWRSFFWKTFGSNIFVVALFYLILWAEFPIKDLFSALILRIYSLEFLDMFCMCVITDYAPMDNNTRKLPRNILCDGLMKQWHTILFVNQQCAVNFCLIRLKKNVWKKWNIISV